MLDLFALNIFDETYVYVIYNLQGIFVTRVTQDGPADRQGLRVGDKILQVIKNM